jgi:hypothetical protein
LGSRVWCVWGLDLMIGFTGRLYYSYTWLQQFTHVTPEERICHFALYLTLVSSLYSSAWTLSESEPYVTTDSQSASLSWNEAPIWGLRPDLYYFQTGSGLLMWGALSDERTGLSFTIAADARQRSHSRVRVPWDSRPYFTIADSRLPYSSPRTTCRATVEELDRCYYRDAAVIADATSKCFVPLFKMALCRKPL